MSLLRSAALGGFLIYLVGAAARFAGTKSAALLSTVPIIDILSMSSLSVQDLSLFAKNAAKANLLIVVMYLVLLAFLSAYRLHRVGIPIMVALCVWLFGSLLFWIL